MREYFSRINKNLSKNSIKIFDLLILFVFLIFTILVFPQTERVNNKNYITIEKSDGVFALSESGKSAPIFVGNEDYTGVIKVARILAKDISNVTHAEPSLLLVPQNEVPKGDEIVLIGTLGKSKLIDHLVSESKIDAKNIEGKWETFLIQVIENPFPDVSRALVIVGSDKRGTIYGMFDLSEKIGVSPWYWWADVPVKQKEKVYVLLGRYSNGEPKVKYRGIFINDEAPALSGWSQEKYGTVQFNHELYEHVFELILRLKGNFLWPAMWGRAFYDDDPLNPKLADEYGIVIGTSHHEPMMRAHVEWQRYGSGPWNYEKNSEKLNEFWTEGIKRMNGYESIVTLAMRGDGDEAMSEAANIGLLERIVKDQREIIKKVTGKEAKSIPQVWALYKEVQEYYDRGMRVPEDVTILLCDDNWGNLRKLPKLNEPPRSGGYGIYYHFDYVGGPRNYKWLNTNQIERVWKQMHLAYEYSANRIWVVNVGDIKPMEFPISFFLDYAWNPEAISAENLPSYYVHWAEKQFGEKFAIEIGRILALYTKYNSRRKPELLSPDTYSLINYREAERIVDNYNELAIDAEKIYNSIPEEYKDAFYQLVLYPVLACANLNELYVTTGRNHLYAKQGRVETNNLANRVNELFNKDAELSHYYNKVMANGKWDHMMDQTHIGYTYWQQPDENNMPEVFEIETYTKAKMGVAVENSVDWYPNVNELTLPEFDKFNRQSYFIEIFNQGQTPCEYSVQANQSWINISETEGTIDAEKRIWISVDWGKVPEGKQSAEITIKGSEGAEVKIYATINYPVKPRLYLANGFIENNGYVSIEPVHWIQATGNKQVWWEIIPNLGRTLSGIAPFPVTSPRQTLGKASPHLQYQIYFFSEGKISVNLYFSPTLNFTNSPDGIKYAISIDDEQPQLMNLTSNPNPPDLNYDPVWNKWVADNINIQSIGFELNKSGWHILKFWMIDPGVVLQKIVIDTGGLKESYLGPPESFKMGE